MAKKEDKVPVSTGSCCSLTAGSMVMHIFVAIAMIALVLSICLVFFYKIGRWAQAEYKPANVMRGVMTMQARCLDDKMPGERMMDGSGVAWKQAKEAPAMPDRIYGNILKVEKNQIVIYNNAAEDQIVLSQAETVIVSSSTEVGISALQVGQNIIVFGAVNKDNQIEAKMITVQ